MKDTAVPADLVIRGRSSFNRHSSCRSVDHGMALWRRPRGHAPGSIECRIAECSNISDTARRTALPLPCAWRSPA